MKLLKLSVLLLLSLLYPIKQADSFFTPVSGLDKIMADYTAGYRDLGIPQMELSYVSNLKNIQDQKGLDKQEVFFKNQQSLLKKVKRSELTPEHKRHYDYLGYELALNLDRIGLQKQFSKAKPVISSEGIGKQFMGKEWYRYYLKEFLSVDISPEQLKEFGQQEVLKVQQQIRQVQKETGYASDSAAFYKHLQDKKFYITDAQQAITKYKEIDLRVKKNLDKLFYNPIPVPLAIAQVPSPNENTPPGYYMQEEYKFYFNFYGNKHNTRSMDFLYIHEGIPGHHYQSALSERLKLAPFVLLVHYFGYSEGWASYCEELGKELGLYQTPYNYLGKLEWDLVRSVRVVMDVGLNYEGWSKEDALRYWKVNIPNQDDIAEREINRMLRWPVQVHTYKVGAAKIEEIKQRYQLKMGTKYDVRAFHAAVLEAGPVPLSVLMNLVLEN